LLEVQVDRVISRRGLSLAEGYLSQRVISRRGLGLAHFILAINRGRLTDRVDWTNEKSVCSLETVLSYLAISHRIAGSQSLRESGVQRLGQWNSDAA
jgi:hypothetical protein